MINLYIHKKIVNILKNNIYFIMWLLKQKENLLNRFNTRYWLLYMSIYHIIFTQVLLITMLISFSLLLITLCLLGKIKLLFSVIKKYRIFIIMFIIITILPFKDYFYIIWLCYIITMYIYKLIIGYKIYNKKQTTSSIYFIIDTYMHYTYEANLQKIVISLDIIRQLYNTRAASR